MLATIAALQILMLSQVGPPPKEVTPDEQATAQATPPGSMENPPLPTKPGTRPPPDTGTTAPPPATGTTAPPPAAGTAAAPARPRQLSLLSGESLGGGSVLMAWAGWKSLGVQYTQGITRQDDLGAYVDLDWSTAEMRLGGFYRRPLGQAGVFDMAGRLTLAWYQNFAATWIHESNHSDRGVELGPGLSLSTPMSGGLFSMIGEAPLTVTTKYGSGLLFTPRFSVAYEAPLYPELTLGARLGVGYRAGSGDAPLKEGSGEFLFLVTATYQIL